ncbi:MAG TPA: sterol desaturase family protein [Steroidobacteraceae bacterium]|nr:sterol desaturase family protein [Steroidobacteraceae bacterium]
MPDPFYTQVVSLVQLVILLLIPLEILLAATVRIRAEYELRDTLASVLVSAGSIYFWGVLGWLFMGGVFFAYAHRLFNVPFTWWSLLIAFVLDDGRYYLWHRVSHRSRWFWASHVVHHSSQHFNLSVNLRQSWTSQFSGLTLLNVPLAFLGFHPATIGLAFSVNLLYQFWIHTEAIDRMPRWFEWLLNTPSHHRVHHARNPRYLDANYAGVFMIWDRLFGTFVAEDREEPARYGLVRDLTTFNPVRIAIHEYVAIARDLLRPGLTLRQRFAYLLAPPGWSHDGTRYTTARLRAAEAARRERSRPPAGPLAAEGVQSLLVAP